MLAATIWCGFGFLAASGRSQKDCPNATPDGVPMQVHEAHSKLFSGPPKKSSLIEQAKKHGDITFTRDTPMPFFDPEQDNSLSHFVAQLTCKSDAVLTGTVLSKSSFATSDERTVFTDFVFQVDEGFRGNPTSLIEPNARLVVARPGGVIVLPDGHTVRVNESAFPPLHISKKYLLFLHYVPATGGYATVLPSSAFAIADGKATRLGPYPIPEEQAKAVDAGLFSALIRQSAQSCESQLEVLQ